jgi:squalene-hopene/tetraprenyl-beta-curcumene cyclase
MRPTLLSTPVTGISTPASPAATEAAPAGAPAHGALAHGALAHGTSVTIDPHSLGASIARASARLAQLQDGEGFWCFHLEADASITAEYILMMHFMDEIEVPLQAQLARSLRATQTTTGGWCLFPGGALDLSCSVKAYYALKLAGDDEHAPHMKAAREAILARGGAARANVFTRITLALFEQIPWRGVPFLPVEIVLLPRWFPFHLHKVSYWSRTVMVPLAILCSLKERARNPLRIGIPELFVTHPDEERDYFPIRSHLQRAFTHLDALGRRSEPKIPARGRRAALLRAARWFIARLNGTDGLGGIFPAMVNAHEALAALGYPANHPYRQQTRTALRRLVVEDRDTAWCQPCVSPVWDTVLAVLAIQEAADGAPSAPVDRALDWLISRQLPDQAAGDWRAARPEVRGGGWPFQFSNAHYPDLDDTAAVVWALTRAPRTERRAQSLASAIDWIAGMQSRNGGFGAFDADNTFRYLNEIPFADHGALLDPPTSDVSGRCAVALARADRARDRTALANCLAFLRREQEDAGPWFGRWGANYIYGTWSVLAALTLTGRDEDAPRIARAAAWLKERQHADGGWGEGCESYWDAGPVPRSCHSTACQTAWALLGLMDSGEVHSAEVRRGILYLLRHQQTDGVWNDPWFNAPGFPRVFFLKYHGYAQYFPLWALARYRNLTRAGEPA